MYLMSFPSLILRNSTSRWCHSPSLTRTWEKLSDATSFCLSSTSIRTCFSLNCVEDKTSQQSHVQDRAADCRQYSFIPYHEVDGGGRPDTGLHQSARRLPGAEHEADVPGNGHGDVRVAPGNQRLAVEELRRRHHYERKNKREEEMELQFYRIMYVILIKKTDVYKWITHRNRQVWRISFCHNYHPH